MKNAESASPPPDLQVVGTRAAGRRDWWIVLGLWVATVLTFQGVLRSDFVSYDDPAYVTHHPMVNQGLRSASVTWALTRAHSSNWNPVTSLSHMLDVSLFGQNAAGHHGVNLLLHALNVALVFLVWRRFGGAVWPAAVVAGLFALHPLHVESVAWVSQRKDLLSTLFWLLAMGAHGLYARAPSWGRWLWVAGFCALALMAKPMAVTLPLTLLLMDFWPLRRWPALPWRRLVAEKTLLFLMCAVHTAITVLAQMKDGAMDANATLPWPLRLSNAAVSCLRYLSKTVWPQSLSPFYPYPAGWPWWASFGAGAMILSVTVLAIRNRAARPWLVFGWFWYLVTLLPVCGLVQTGLHAMADRYTYVPLLGIFTVAVWALQDWRRGGARWRMRAANGAVGTALILFSWQSMRQVGVWHTAETLLARMEAVAGPDAVLFRERALLLKLRGAPPSEVADPYRQGLEHHPNHEFFLLELSVEEARLGRFAEAKALIERARAQAPENPGWQFNLGSIEMMEGRLDDAVATLEAGLERHPEVGSAHGQIGRIRMAQGRIEEAVAAFKRAVACDDMDWLSQNELGVALYQAGALEAAVAALEQAHWLNPADAGIRQNLGHVRKLLQTSGK